jgi:hypothetical protein
MENQRYPFLVWCCDNSLTIAAVFGFLVAVPGVALICVFLSDSSDFGFVMRMLGFGLILVGILKYFVIGFLLDLVRVFLDLENNTRRFVDGD